MDNLGRLGRVWREADDSAAELEAVILDLLAGQYKSPIRVVAFNTAEHWSQDVSADVAQELRRRCDLQQRDIPFFLQDFVDRYEGRYRDIQLPLPIFRPSGPAANAYKHGAVSTEITQRRKSGSDPVWCLDAVERASVYPRDPVRFNFTICDTATRNAVKRTLAAFGRDVVRREFLAPADAAAIAGLAA